MTVLGIVGSRDNLLIFELHVLDVFILIGDSLCDVPGFDRFNDVPTQGMRSCDCSTFERSGTIRMTLNIKILFTYYTKVLKVSILS